MKFLKIFLSATIVLFVTALCLKAEEAPTFVQFARPLAMGQAFTAVADDNNLFAYNPAGLVQRTGSEFTLLEIMGGMSEDAMKAYKFVKDNQDHLTHFESFASQDPPGAAYLVNKIRTDISRLNPHIFASADVASYLSGPSFWGAHLGIGALGSTDDRFFLNSPQPIPSITYFFNSDVMVPVTLAKRWDNVPLIPGKLGVGVTAKFIRRFQVFRVNESVTELDNLKSPPVSKGKAFGGDVGLLYQPTNRVNAGMMVQDFGGTKMSFEALDAKKGFPALPGRDTVIRPRTNLGLAMVPSSLLFLLPTNDRWTFSADINDVMSPREHVLFQNGLNRVLGENLYTHLHFGAEFRYWFMRFRGGINQGYPCGGLGIDIPFLKIDYAYFVRELGEFAGDVKEVNHAISLAIKFGSGNVEGRERIKKAKEANKQKNVGAPEGGQEVKPANQAAPAPNAPAKEASPKESTPTGEKTPADKQEIPK